MAAAGEQDRSAEPRPSHPTSGGATQAFRAAAGELAARPEVWRRILREHTRTGDGYCVHPQCGRPGYGTPFVPYPCATRVLASIARGLHRVRTDDLPAPVRSDPHD